MTACAQQPSPAVAPDVVAYRVKPQTADGELIALNVDVTFSVGPDGSMLVRMPWRYAGRDDLLSFVDDIAVAGGVLTATDRPAEKLVTAVPNKRVSLSYSVRSSLDADPTSADGQPFAPWIRDTWFMIDGSSFFARPQVEGATAATFTWEGNPATPFASDLQRFHAPASGGTVHDIFTGTMLGGPGVRILTQGQTRVALRGTLPISDSALLDGISRLLQAERDFWGERTDTPYLVNLASVPTRNDNRASFAGTGHGDDAFDAVVSGEVRYRDLMGKLFAHEIFHGWMPAQLGVPATPVNAWFGEGFTEYYGRALSVRAGVVSLDEFAAIWNEALIAYMVSPARNQSNEQLQRDHWQNRDSGLMPYLRGSMLAALWRHRLAAESGGGVSLDDLLRAQRDRTMLAGGPPVSAEDLLARLAATVRVNLADDIDKYVTRGETLLLPPDTFGRCFSVEKGSIPRYERGFDLEASVAAGMVAKNVAADGPAYAAGLREGMSIVRPVAGRAGDSTIEVVLVVEVNGAERTLRWMPEGRGMTPIQRVVRVQGSPDSASACGI
jgi:predicted metalloprotease with PDZ domain